MIFRNIFYFEELSLQGEQFHGDIDIVLFSLKDQSCNIAAIIHI